MKIGIIGLGLIGGSILKNLAEKNFQISAVTRNPKTIEEASKLTEECSNDLSILKDCDIVFICTPINKITEVLDELEKVVSPNCIVTDTASVKMFVTEKKRPYKFIPSHPMAGTENSGYFASFKELFQGAKWVLTPYDCQDTQILSQVISEMGAEPIITNAKEHDEAVALISHMPMYISQCLYQTASKNKLALKLASSGFRDTTRLAMTDLNLAKDMLNFNRENILKTLDLFINQLNSLKNNYSDKTITEIRNARKNLYSKDGKNIYKD